MRTYDNENKVININSFILAIVLMASPIAGVLSLAFEISQNANGYILVSVLIMFALRLFFVKGKKDTYRVDSLSLVLIILTVMLYILTEIFNPQEIRYTFIHLFFYVIIPILCINLNVNTEKVLRYCLYISLFTVLAGNKWFAFRYLQVNQADMGKVYALVTMTIIAMFHFAYYRKKATKCIKLCYIYNSYMLLRMIMVANRGAALALLFTAVLIAICKFDERDIKMTSSWVNVLLVFVIAVIVFVVINNIIFFLDIAQNIFDKLFNKVPSVILKMKMYAAENNIMNGRLELYKYTWQEIKKSPLYGHGMVTFYNHTNGADVYPHNFILQHLYEGGIIFTIIPTFLSGKLLYEVLIGKITDKHEFALGAMLVCQCIPKLLFSTDAWFNTTLWMMIAFSAMRIKKTPFKIDLKKIIEKTHTE